ncbi:hypothetical protein MKW94_012003 [Papaver nudicaule]|uniref:Vacuolar protein sorting-associated protein 13 VPS13 adaptor binding domain-containing protein n=1 Tax=Papaver nudicaule TaxID=74823 RepID=A0AA41VPM6_PAPNU|nr:hypothetical protein [Papaver nudicaule]
MFSIRSKLVSMLQPWLLTEPDLELNLGFLRSSGTLKNLRLDITVLNQLIKDSNLHFKDFRVDNLSFQFSSWSVPAFTVEVHGVHVTLTTREIVDGERSHSRGIQSAVSGLSEEKKKILSIIDPEGITLHDRIEKISVATPARNQLSNSLMNVIFKQCLLQMHGIHVEVQFPVTMGSIALFNIEKFSVESSLLNNSSILGSVFRCAFVSDRESSLVINASGMEIELKRENHANTVFYSNDVVSHIKLKDLQLLDFEIRAAQLDFAFCPIDLPILQGFDVLLPKVVPCRSGRELWNIAASRMCYLTSSTRSSLHQTINLVRLWLRYVHAYESLLSLVGYYGEKKLEKATIRVSTDKSFRTCVKHQWKVITEIEKELPAEALARARRVARYREATHTRHTQSINSEPLIEMQKIFSGIWKILSLFSIIWNTICWILYPVIRFFSVKNGLDPGQETDESFAVISEDFSAQSCFSLVLGKVSIAIYPINAVPRADLDLRSFHMVLDTLFLVYIADNTTQSLSLSCGDLKVNCTHSSVSPLRESNLKKEINRFSTEGRRKEKSYESSVVVWSEPAPQFVISDKGATESSNSSSNASSMHLENYLKELWSNWKGIRKKLEGNKVHSWENPFLIFENRNFLIVPGLTKPGCGLSRCYLTMGKFNFDLGYSSIMSVAMLVKQFEHTLSWDAISRRRPSSHTSVVRGKAKQLRLQECYESYTNGVKVAMLRMIPEKNIEVGVAIAGSTVRILLQDDGLLGSKEQRETFTQGHGDILLAIDLENIEIAVWPTQEPSTTALTGELILNDARTEKSSRKEPWSRGTVHEDVNYISELQITLDSCLRMSGLNAYFEDVGENRRSYLIVLKPVVIQSSSCKECVDSLATNISTLSTSLHGIVKGVTILSYMDEIWVIFQVVECIFSRLPYDFASLDSIYGVHTGDITRETSASGEDTPNGGSAQVYEVEGAFLISKSMDLVIDATFDFGPHDIILESTRKNTVMENNKQTYGASNSKKLPIPDVPEHGLGVFLQQARVQISLKEGVVKLLIDLFDIKSVIFRYQNLIEQCSRGCGLIDLLHLSRNCLYEFSFSDCSLALSVTSHVNALTSGEINGALPGSISGSKSPAASNDPPSTSLADESNIQPHVFNKIFEREWLPNTSSLAPSLSYDFLIDVQVGEILMANNLVRNALTEEHQPKILQSSLSISGDLHTISWTIQGGLIVLETAALAMFLHCFDVYYLSTKNLLPPPGTQPETVQPVEGNLRSESTLSSVLVSETRTTPPESKWGFVGVFRIILTQFSLILVVADESGGIWELMLEADFHLNLDFKNSKRKLCFDNSRLSILSQHLAQGSADETANGIQLPPFRSVKVKETSTQASSCDSMPPGFLYDSSSPDPKEEFKVEVDASEYSQIIDTNCIVEHVAASLMIENAVSGDEVMWKSDWVGNGSVSGLDFTISLSEIQMLLSLVAPFSAVPSVESTSCVEQNNLSRSQEPNNASIDTIPDGAVVALQDMHQHMYLAVEDLESNYSLTGVIHYSLAKERALFRVKHCSRRSWGLPVSWFTLISLHAKSSSGEALRLNYRRRSSFVDISSIVDDDGSLWKALPYQPDSYEGDTDSESYRLASKNTFYLVNKKCDYGVAFIDGLPEFVGKPGNPFKLKVFHDYTVTHDALSLITPLRRPFDADEGQNSDIGEEESSSLSKDHPYLSIKIDKLSVNIVHSVLNAKDKFPLLQGCISNIQFIIQVLSSKVRVISTFTAAVLHFDAQTNLWREIVQPVGMCMFYRTKFAPQISELVPQGVPVNFYFRMNQVDVYLTELSLDILLFMVGKLNLAGPYAVKNSKILANCCKVENQSGLNILCHFYDNQDSAIAGKQSALIFLRDMASIKQFPENSSFVSVQLDVPGSFSTSPIHISLLKAQIFAWRTRVVLLKDSRSYPGPFVVVELSKKTEDGLSIVVSPILRIHNETGYSMMLRFQRPQQEEAESASFLLRSGDTVDDCMASVDAMNLSGGSKKALMSLSLGNFLFSIRPEVSECFGNSGDPVSINWSEDLKGGKAVRLSGVFDKLSYRFKRSLGVESVRHSFGTVRCSINMKGARLTDLHFLVQTIGRDVPVIHPGNIKETTDMKTSPVAIQEQKEIFLLPTVCVFNCLQSEIHVLITETYPDLGTSGGVNHTGKEASIEYGSSACLYGNPAMIYFTVTLTEFNLRCKPVNSGDWVHKQKSNTNYLDIDLDFGSGKYFASLRLRGNRGILEAAVFTSYSLHNDSDLTLFCFTANQKPLSREEADRLGSSLSPERGTLLPPKSTKSWLLKSNKLQLILVEEKASAARLDLDALSRFTELCLEVDEGAGIKVITKLSVSLNPYKANVLVPSQIVSLVPRYVVFNESPVPIIVRQCYLEDVSDGIIAVNSKQRAAVNMKSGPSKRRVIGTFDSFLKKHGNTNEDSLMYIQFCLDEVGWNWSGPICVASLGRFFLKFRRSLDSTGNQSNTVAQQDNKMTEFAVVHVVEEGSTLVLHFHRPPNISLPYRIENSLRDASITYYQKESSVPENLGSGDSVGYVWDDLSLPHKLVVHIPGMRLSREINMEKVCDWKPLLKVRQQRGLALEFPLDKRPGKQKRTGDGSIELEIPKVGYEVYTDGSTRVLRISEFQDCSNEDKALHPCAKIQFRVSNFVIHLLEQGNQDEDEDASQPADYSPLIIARLGNINLDSVYTDRIKYNQIKIQSLDVEEKWAGAPFAAMLRRDQLNYLEPKGNILFIAFTLVPTNSNVKQVNYASIILQPLDLNIDEETLMKLVPFWRTSFSDSKAPSRQFYFKHFEIHPIKIVASFLPGSSDSNYSSAQETLRSLLHSVIKIPAVKNKDVELNGILVTHALVTVRELLIKCAQHYSWYAMRAVYIAKGSPLLPPAFASIFDDSASSSLDVFFDPSSGLINLPGITLGMFKFISKSINKKGFSGTKRYIGDLGKTVKTAGSNVLFAAITEVSDCILRGAEANGFNGMITGFHQGILRLAMEPSLLGTAVMEGGPDRKIKLDRSPGVDELYIEGYLQAMLDALYKQEYLRVRVIDNQVILKNLPPSTSLISEIMDRVNSFLMSKGLLKGELPASSRPLRHLRGETEWKLGPTILTLWEHLFVSFTIRMLRNQADKVLTGMKQKGKSEEKESMSIVPAKPEGKFNLQWGISKFVFSGLLAYIDGRLCRCIPNSIVRRVVSGFLLTFLDKRDNK